MSRIPKWKLEKTKVKVVFRLQFHATHIPQTGWDKLFVSFISDETGRVTAKTNKANVRNGTCKWADPIYETTRLLQDRSAKKYEDKFYKLVVATGTSRSSLLGETFINLADHADALKPTSIALPLEGYDFGTILHVSIQLLTCKTGFREFEQQRETREKDFHLISNPTQEPLRKLDKANASGRFKQEPGELYPLEEMDEAGGDFEDSATGIDGSSCTSESIPAEKGEISGPSGSATPNITINDSQHTHDGSPHHLMVHGWSSDFSVDNKLSSLYDENTKLRRCLETAESSVLEMKTEVDSLKLVAEELGAETQRLTHQFTSELVSGEALYEEVSALKSECSKVKDEFEVLRHYKRMLHLNGRRADSFHNPDSLHGVKEWADKSDGQSQCLEGLMFLDKKVKLLRSKMQIRCHEKDVELISDFEGIDFVLQSLKQRVMISSSSSSIQAAGSKQITPLQTLLDQELENKKTMNERICKLLTELEESKSERETLNRKMNQKVLHYDAFILELEERNLQALNELERVKSMHLSSLSTTSALQTEIEKMTRDTNDKFVKLSEEKWSLESVNKELEKRAAASEATLKRIRSTYSTAVNRLQKDLELLSTQVLSIFEMNENLAKQSLDGAPKSLYCDNHEFLNVGDRSNFPNLNGGKLKNYAIPRSGESCYLKELHELHALNLHLHVLVEVLKETLLEKRLLERDTKAKMDELSESKELLIHEIEVAYDEVRVLREDAAKFRAKSEDLLAEKNTLETKFQDACDQNSSALKNLITDLKISKMRHVEEISALEDSLKEESFQKSCMKAELDEKSSALNNLELFFYLLAERLRILCSNVEPFITQMNTYDFKLSRVLASPDKKPEKSDYLAIISQLEELQLVTLKEVLKLSGETKEREKDNDSLRVLLEDLRSELEEIRSKFVLSDSVSENLRLELRMKAESEEKLIAQNKDLTSKLTIMEYKLQDAYIEKGDMSKIQEELERAQKESTFQLEKELVNLKDQLSILNETLRSKSEELHDEKLYKMNMENQIKDLKSQLSSSNELNSELSHLRQQIIDLESSKSALQSKVTYLDTELCKARERLGCSRDELHAEREGREKLHATVSELTSLLNEKQKQVLYFSNQKAELTDLQKQIVALESEKSALNGMLTSSEKRVSELGAEISSLHFQLQSEKEIRLSELTQVRRQVLDLETVKEEREREVLELTSLFENREAELTQVRRQVLDLETVKEEREREVSELTSLFENREAELTSLRQKASEMESDKAIRMNLESTLSEVSSLLEEKQQQLVLLKEEISEAKSENSELVTEISNLHSQLLSERDLRSSESTQFQQQVLALEIEVSELTSLLNEKEQWLISFEGREAELTGLKQKVSEHESTLSDLQSENSELHELLLSAHIEYTFVQTQYQNYMQDLFSEFTTIERRYTEIQKMGSPSKQFEEEMERLRSSKEEHEIAGIVFQSKFFELYEQNQDLSRRLSEQILKAEEFKNLSIHLKNQNKEKRERDSSTGAAVESLRVAFIKEQCEVRVQELQIQLDISKKHGEDLLLKLQSALDEIELRKKNEASHTRRNEEQSLKIVELESSKRAFDEIRAELECSVISAECCKEEKTKVEASLRECTLEVEKLRDELLSAKSQLHNLTAKNLEEMNFQRDDRRGSVNGFKENSSDDQRREQQNFRDGIERLKQELQKMKEENLETSISAQGEELRDPSLRELEKELIKLELANQNLGAIFPAFQDIPGNGNALERVLALELELAEALQTKNKPDFVFQSSFLRQLGDEAAVLRSFRDINELIGDMLHTKGKHAAIESELKEMHGRYTQLSLRLAEVEGERQKLLMKLKNSRSPKKLQP